MKERVEHIIFKKEGDTIHVVGFILGEDENEITISFTKSYGEYADIQTIQKRTVLEREIVV